MKKFKKIYTEITNVCNLKCEFCPQTKRKPKFISVEEFEKVLNKIKPHGDYIYFHVKGEPLLHPDLDKLLDMSYQKGFKAHITTNATLIKKTKEKIIGKDGLRQINISLHSFDGNNLSVSKEEYIKDVVEATNEFLEKSKTIVALRLWNLDKDNEINLSKNKNREILSILEESFNLDYKIEEKITSERGIKLKDRLYLNRDHEFQWPSLEAEDLGEEGFCYGLRNQIAILVDGTVVPCCLDGEGIINLGNIYEKTLEQIMESDRAKAIYDGFSKGKAVEEMCRRCGYRERF